MNRNLFLLGITFATTLAAQATTLTAVLTCDDDYEAYISTNDSVQGTLFMENFGIWNSIETGSTALTAGVENYLHIRARNNGGNQMIIGQLTLSDADFSFDNNTQFNVSNTTDWRLSRTGWGLNNLTAIDLGPDGTSPWGNQAGIDNSARFIWSETPFNTDDHYWSIRLTPVPEPATMSVLALAAVAAIRRRKQSK